MYKACPTEKCNKSVVDQGNGNYRCEKCAQSFNNFNWRYILRVAIADATDYEVIILFFDILLHSALKLEKNCNFKSKKTHFSQFQKWQKTIFAPEKSLKLHFR